MSPDQRKNSDQAISDLYRSGPRPSPSPEIDARILAHSKRASPTRSRPAHSPFARSWVIPVSLAATLVLSVGVVTLVERDTGEFAPALHDGRGVPPASAPVGKVKEVPADAPAAAGEARESAVPSRRAASPAEAESVLDETAPAAPGAPAPAMTQPAQRLPLADDSVAPAAPPPPPPAQRPRTDETALGGSRKTDAGADRAYRRSPEAWLAYIDRLLAAERTQEAKASLAQFKNRFPEYPLEERHRM